MDEYAQIHEKYLGGLVKLLDTMPEQTDAMQQSLVSLRQVRQRNFNEETIRESDNGNEDLAQAMSTPHSNRYFGIPTTAKLAPLQIKSFSGNLVDWPEFKSTCETTFANIANEVDRFRYLKSYLSEAPYRMIRHLPLVPGSYERAMELLKKRFDNERAIINAHFQRVIQLPTLKAESANGIRYMVNTINECITALNGYKINTDSWFSILIFLLTQRLDATSIKHWEEKIEGQHTIPSFTKFIDFLETRITVLENTSRQEVNDPEQKRAKTFINMEKIRKCNLCLDNSSHFTYTCPQLLDRAPSERIKFIEEKGLCSNCLHFHKEENCNSRFSCKLCGKRHNSVLHIEERVHLLATSPSIDEFMANNPDVDTEIVQAMEMAGEFVAHINDLPSQTRVLLATAIVKIETEDRFLYAKSLIDQGSTANLITERTCKALALPMERMNTPIVGVCDAISYKVTYKTTITITSSTNADYSIRISALIVPKITTLHQTVSFEAWPHLRGLELADPHTEKLNRIDILLGAAVHGDILDIGLIKGNLCEPIAQKTQLGWIVSGGGGDMNLRTPVFSIQTADEHLSKCLTKFWETEELPSRKFFTEEEQLAEDIYVRTTKRCDDGRLMVKLPFKNNGVPNLGQSYHIAKRRYDYMVKRYANKPEFQKLYDQCIQQYLDLGHMELSTSDQTPHNYLFHHPVIKESSSTTKIRPVYDASCKTSNGNSLNSQLLVGPTIQSDLFSLLIRWRKGKIAISGDIEQMYRQVWVFPEDSEYQRIFWTPPGSTEVKSYRLKTVGSEN